MHQKSKVFLLIVSVMQFAAVVVSEEQLTNFEVLLVEMDGTNDSFARVNIRESDSVDPISNKDAERLQGVIVTLNRLIESEIKENVRLTEVKLKIADIIRNLEVAFLSQVEELNTKQNDYEEQVLNLTYQIEEMRKMNGRVLCDAAWNENFNLVKVLVSFGVNVNATDGNRDTPLILATSKNRTDIVKYLIQSGANLDATNKNNDTALRRAAERNYTNICKILLDAGADPNIQHWDGDSALSSAITTNNREVVIMLLQKGANVNIANRYGFTPLHVAAWEGAVKIAKNLVHNGANLSIKTDYGYTPLGIAKLRLNHKMIQYLESIYFEDFRKSNFHTLSL